MKITSLGVHVRPGGPGPSIQIQLFVQEAFTKLIFFKSIFSRKNWRGGSDLSLKNSKYNRWLRLLTMLLRGVPDSWGISHIFLPNIGKEQKKSLHLSAGSRSVR